jgi:hypothetical protein
VRPRIRATRKPRRVILTDGLTRGWWPQRGDIWFSVMPSFRACGARPSRGGQSKLGWPSGENPGITRRAVFSEGRTLCVRKYGPDPSPGISFPPHASKMTRRPSGNMCRLGPSHPCGRAEPAPPRGQAQHGWPYGGRPGDDARDGFLGGTHSVRPRCKAVASPGVT